MFVFWTSFLALWRNVLMLSILVEIFHFCSRIKFKSENLWGGLEPPLPLPLLRACFVVGSQD